MKAQYKLLLLLFMFETYSLFSIAYFLFRASMHVTLQNNQFRLHWIFRTKISISLKLIPDTTVNLLGFAKGRPAAQQPTTTQ